MFSLQVLGAVAQLERALIAERTRAGLRAARSRGRIGGNPGLRARDPEAIRKVRKSRDAAYLNTVLAQVDAWLPIVRRMRPDQPWGMLSGFSTADRPHQHTTLPAESGPSSDCAAPSIGSSLKVWLAVAYWAELLHRGVTIGWYAWLPASRRRHPATPCSRSPLSSRPCVSAPLGVARAGIHLRSGSCLSGPDVSASFQPDIARSRNSRTTPYVGSHLLRHSLAIRLVNTGPRSTTRLAKCRSVRRSARPLQCQG